MTYHEIINEAIDTLVTTDDNSGLTYLEPLYKETIRSEGWTEPDAETGEPVVTMEELAEILKLTVEKRNAQNNRTQAVVDWIFTVIENGIDPLVEDEQNDLIKNMMDYMKLNEEVKQKEKQLDNKEKELTMKDRILGKNDDGLVLDFSKRKG